MDNIRNFSIIAHIDHGKSTLADRLIEYCGGLSDREMSEQVLDSMDLERERGITIKAQTASLKYKARNGKVYELNLIDTPGHVDFSYEVSRSLSACEGALLVVDATQGVEAQTVANCYTAIDLGVSVVPVLNKMDLNSANPDAAKEEIEDVIGIDATDAVLCSAKTGMGIEEILERVVTDVPPPKGDENAPLQALIIDSWFDNYVGIVTLVRVINGVIRPKDKVMLMATGATHLVEQVGVFTPKAKERDCLKPGEVGFVVSGIKELKDARVGDTITSVVNPAAAPLPGFKEVKPQVFAGLYPVESNQYDADLITTAPSVVYEVLMTNGEVVRVENPSKLPPVDKIAEIREPIDTVTIFVPNDYVGTVMKLCQEKRGIQINMAYHGRQVHLTYELPLAEIVLDFFDRMKSITRGYASMDYEFKEYRASDVVKVDMLINGDRVDALSSIVHRTNAVSRGRDIVTRLRSLIPRQMYDVAIQAAIGGNIIARENVKALRKNVLAKCYGGDITRKKKLLEKQKAGKKRMKQVGSVEIPQEAFLAILQVDDKK